MYTLMHCSAPIHEAIFTVKMDVAPDIINPPDEHTRALVADAKKAMRKLGTIERPFANTTFFSYHPDRESDVEMSLLSTLSLPRLEVTVNADSTSAETWSEY